MGYREGNKTCKVVRLLPFEDGQPLYRVKFTDEQVERVVKEFQLSHAS
jgi:Ser/Thr protein kinase RdoA (MazF antagonist)